ncbi:sugar ABC transporter ATP-binding protein [Ruminococcus sp. OA3]|uniref:sugar ABC transporter ATP-binding protein n=1 Tax=Ruminococcus sp. OA3 TaxID=2914164 RepID=UPI001F051CC4|nr:sugar ABC transporter ATP-binding protein [Ruminococcus sp. OA3]MCH1981463.1 sugar ABC transporter ATP-binding protein [Ruminococcus sp. OA3]
MPEYILEMQEITKSFPGVLALDRVSFRVAAGEVHALVGENGAGKSTLMKVLSGVYQKDSGKLLLEGTECIFRGVKESEEAGVAIVHQELNIVKNLTVCENIFLGNEMKRNGIIDWEHQYLKAKELLDMVGLQVSPATLANELSPGQQQMLEIVRAINKNVKALIFDEPTSSLTDQETEVLLTLILKLQRQGVSIIYISHKLSEVFQIANTVTVLRDGKTIVTKSIRDIDEGELIAYMVGRELTNLYPESTHQVLKETALEVQDWSVINESIPGKMLLNKISIHANRGEILGIAGLMGAGRTELALSLFGAACKPVSGTLKINGQEKKIHSPKEAIENGISYVTEDRKKLGLVLNNSIRANIALPNFNKLARFGIINNNKEIQEVARFSKELQVKTPSIMQLTRNLSGGNQQKVILAKWLMTDPDILIVDEPTRGIDVGAKYEIYTIMDKLAAQGKCVIVISSEMPEIIGICDRVYVMNEGRIVGELNKQECISQTEIMRCIQGGTTDANS